MEVMPEIAFFYHFTYICWLTSETGYQQAVYSSFLICLFDCISVNIGFDIEITAGRGGSAAILCQ